MKRLVILGSTGSIGRQTIEVARQLQSEVNIVGLSTYSNINLLKSQIREFRPKIACIIKEDLAEQLSCWCRKSAIKSKVVCGLSGLIETARYARADLLLSAVVGSIGLEPLIAAIRSGKDIALANKEALVIAGQLIVAEAKKHKVKIVPVDSEHSAIFQCLKDEDARSVKKIVLTASGGPFYKYRKKLSGIKVSDALDHPTWDMGPKITVDSATLMNKGLEAIEAHHLFNTPLANITILIHPQSIVHSMVEFVDGAVIAHMSCPDMKLPIQYALTYPQRCQSKIKKLDLARTARLEFDSPDFTKFPCLGLALKAGRVGGTMPAVMNAANEVAVGLFLNNRIKFTDIAAIIRKVMLKHRTRKKPNLKQILKADAWARAEVKGGSERL